jgi:hypothetical protein
MSEVPDWFVTNMAVALAHEQDNITIRDPTGTQNVSTYFGENGEWDEGVWTPEFDSDSEQDQPAIGIPQNLDWEYADGLVTVPFHYKDTYTVDYESPSEDADPNEPSEPIVKECTIEGEVCLSYNAGELRAWAELDVNVGQQVVEPDA